MDESEHETAEADPLPLIPPFIRPDTNLDDPDQVLQQAVFADFYRSFKPQLVGFLRWQGVPLAEATEIAQETMIKVHRHWDAIEKPAAWARTTASRMWTRHIANAPEIPTADVPEQSSALLPITDIATWEQRHDILQLLDQLPARQRQVLAWTLDGYSPAEIAEELKITPEAVRSNLFKARRVLAKNPDIIGGTV